jgi:hypothetical protein
MKILSSTVTKRTFEGQDYVPLREVQDLQGQLLEAQDTIIRLTDNSRVDVDRFNELQRVVKEVYRAGWWDCVTIPGGEQDKLWEKLRDAASIEPGESR